MVLDTYWKFGAERLAMYRRRLAQPNGPWTDDPILRTYRFTNSFRAADRVSQYLIREIQYDSARSPDPAEVIFRTLLFKIFNKVETCELLETQNRSEEHTSELQSLMRISSAIFCLKHTTQK